MRLIDADALKEIKCKYCIKQCVDDGYVCGEINLINSAPTASDIVHCCECRWWKYPVQIQGLSGKTDHIGQCTLTKWLCGRNGFCMYGAMKENEVVE